MRCGGVQRGGESHLQQHTTLRWTGVTAAFCAKWHRGAGGVCEVVAGMQGGCEAGHSPRAGLHGRLDGWGWLGG